MRRTHCSRSTGSCLWEGPRGSRMTTSARRESSELVYSLKLTSSSDLLATFGTKRTPIMKTHYTPRNLCMVAGAFIPPAMPESNSNGSGRTNGHSRSLNGR